MKLRVAQIIEKTEAEGPGERFALWVQGCPIRCPGCCNPEMLSKDGGTEMSVDDLFYDRILPVGGIEGITLLGGEPFAQADACANLATKAQALGLTVTVFTGFTLEKLRERRDKGVRQLLEKTDLLIDGPFRQELPERRRRWVGSTNQEMHFLTDVYSPEDRRFSDRNTVEIRFQNGELVVNGWPAFEVKGEKDE